MTRDQLFGLGGKVAAVIGAGSGIGAAVALGCARPPGESAQGHAADGGRTRLRQHGAGPGGGARGRNRRAGVVLRPPVLRTD